jgi:hypothetical protein
MVVRSREEGGGAGGKEHAYADALAAAMGGSRCEHVGSMMSRRSRRTMCISGGEWVAGYFFLGGGLACADADAHAAVGPSE